MPYPVTPTSSVEDVQFRAIDVEDVAFPTRPEGTDGAVVSEPKPSVAV